MFKWLQREKFTQNLSRRSLPNIHSSDICQYGYQNKLNWSEVYPSNEPIKKSESTAKLLEKMEKFQMMLQTELFKELKSFEGQLYFSPKARLNRCVPKSENAQRLDRVANNMRRHSSPVVPTTFASSNIEEFKKKDFNIPSFSNVLKFSERNNKCKKDDNEAVDNIVDNVVNKDFDCFDAINCIEHKYQHQKREYENEYNYNNEDLRDKKDVVQIVSENSGLKLRRASSPGFLGIKLKNEQQKSTSLPQVLVENNNNEFTSLTFDDF
ncbi:uncharacterized protein LOC136075287 [Hydra vulgaris]|uniref:Uncharacterized protein LOC136075287 n=1 Tax=Hydra vulgaris TaxID=6087 RepID=A0ABM4B571_HYDVU